MLGIAALSLAVIPYLHPLLEIHETICGKLLGWTGLPVVSRALVVFPGVAAINVPFTSGAAPALGRITVILVVLAFLVLSGIAQFRFPMARSVVLFVAGLVTVATIVSIINPELRVFPADFALVWLRTQGVLWVLLPVIVAILVVPVDGSLLRGILLSSAVWGYGVLWSAFRLVFCLAVLHETGLAFVTALWFACGPLGDLIYILCFYSLVIRRASIRLWGGTNAWAVSRG